MLKKANYAMIEESLQLIDSVGYASSKCDVAIYAIAHSINEVHYDILMQLYRSPTQDGNICSKSMRDELKLWKLATDIIINKEDGYTGLTNMGLAVLKTIEAQGA
jgi:hypothetical protein